MVRDMRDEFQFVCASGLYVAMPFMSACQICAQLRELQRLLVASCVQLCMLDSCVAMLMVDVCRMTVARRCCGPRAQQRPSWWWYGCLTVCMGYVVVGWLSGW